jgi:ADP-heptose:LPS heptosyltransferase
MIVSTIIKIFARINLWIGFLLRKKRSLAGLNNIKTILVKRTDRLGDAVVVLPFLLELAKHFELTILTSEYNDYFLRKFFKTKIFVEKPRSFLENIKIIIVSFFRLFSKRDREGERQYDVFLDLNGIRELDIFLKIRNQNLCRYYVGFNMGLWNFFLDYSYNTYPVLFSGRNLVDSCRGIVKDTLGRELSVPDYIDLSDKIIKPQGFDMKDFILINIAGGDKFRGPSVEAYAEIINGLGSKNKIVVMDELKKPNMEVLKKHVKRENVIYLNKDFSIWELLYIASISKAYVGADSGISHLLQIPSNAILFFATGNQEVWKPYSKNSYSRQNVGNLVIDKTVNSKGFRKVVVEAPAFCKPCFDMGCRKRWCVNKFNKEIKNIVGEIEEISNVQ